MAFTKRSASPNSPSTQSRSQSRSQKGNIVTVKGQYYASGDGKRMIRTYGPEDFFIPEKQTLKVGFEYRIVKVDGAEIKRSMPKFQEVNGLAYALHIVQRYLLPARLSSKLKDYIRFRTCMITNTRPALASEGTAGDLSTMNVGTMSLEQLRTLVNLKGLPIPLDSFATIADARQAVKDELDNQAIALKAREDDGGEETSTGIPGISDSDEDANPNIEDDDGVIQTSKVDPNEEELFA